MRHSRCCQTSRRNLTDIEQFKKQAKVQEIPGGFDSVIKHYSMDTQKMKKQAKEFKRRQNGTVKNEAWCAGSNTKATNDKKGRKLMATEWNHNGDAIGGVSSAINEENAL